MEIKLGVVAHAGSASDPSDSDGPQAAVQIGMELLKNGESPLEAVVQTVRYLEDDPRFNAGLGAPYRANGSTIQMDASCMTSTGQFGAVACVEGIQNPVDIAKGVLLHSSCIIIFGEGSKVFALDQNISLITLGNLSKIQQQKNLTKSCDTVGAVAFDGKTFAAALSTGGLSHSPIGRVGDVPLPGCGLFCGPIGSIACTGDGEYIALKILAKEVYGWLEQGMTPESAAKKAIGLFDDSVDIGIIIITKNEFSSHSRDGMAWSHKIMS